MTTLPEEDNDYKPRDIGTSLASSIAIIFISTILYSSVLSEKERIHSLKDSTWYDVELTLDQSLESHVTKFRTGERRLYLDFYHSQIYEQSCASFNSTCKALEEGKFKLESATFYSNHDVFNPSSHLVLKSISFTDAEQQPQNLIITSTTPNDPAYTKREKWGFLISFAMIFFIFSLFTFMFYFNHIIRYIDSIETIKLINKGIIVYYCVTTTFVILQILLM